MSRSLDPTTLDHLHALVDNMPELAWTALPDGHIDFYNRRWFEYTGTTLDEMEGRGWTKVHHPEHVDAVVARFDASIATGEPFEMEFPLRGANGTYRWFLTRMRPMRDERGRVTRWFGTNTDIDDRKRLEHALAAQSRLTKAITDNASVALFLMDDRQRCTFMNPAAEALTGFTLAEVLARDEPLHDIIHHTRPDGRPYPLAECPIDRALPTRAREQGTDVFVHRDGSLYPVSFTASPLVEDGRPVGTVIEVQDLTASERREAWLEAVVEGSPIGIAVLDRDLRFVRVNAALAALNRLPAAAHLGRTIAEVLPFTAGAVSPLYRRVMETKEPLVAHHLQSVWQDRSWHFDLSIYPIVVQGRVEGVVGLVQDITDRKREEQRRELLARASRVFATSLDVARTLKEVSRLFVPDLADYAVVYTRSDDDTPTSELAACTHRDPEHEPLIREAFARAPREVRETFISTRTLASGESLVAETIDEASWVAAAQDHEDWRTLARPLRPTSSLSVPMLVQGRAIGVVVLATTGDARHVRAEHLPIVEEVARRAATAVENAHLFEMAQAERRRADEANRAKDEFLAVVSHELRTPLNAILGWARMLLGGSLPPPQIRRATEVIERNAHTQAQLIEDLLDYSRIISGKLRLEIENIDLVRIVEAAIDVVMPAAEAKGVTIRSELDPGIGTTVGDPSRMQQVVWNLLTNAVKFTPAGGRIVVRLAREGSSCVITVTDTGAGIPAEFLPYVFERFRQADMGSKRRHGGLGLGLAIVRHIVELHGGTVEGTSEGVGKGATFRIVLPLVATRRTPRADGATRTSSPPLSLANMPGGELVRGLSLLVVDDEPDARELLSSMLDACGAHVVTAPSAKEALARMKERTFDVLVSDIGMPDEDGYDLIERVRAMPPAEGGRVPAIALTAYARSADRTRALLAGYNAHVTKPVDAGELLAVVATVSGRTAPT